jgi:hypothetical protein
MRFLILDSYYPGYLTQHYTAHPSLASAPYELQRSHLIAGRFGISDAYSSALKGLGHEAEEIIINAQPLQMQWAKENGLRISGEWHWKRWHGVPVPSYRHTEWMPEVIRAQIKAYRPEVVFLQSPTSHPNFFFRELRPYFKLLLGQLACRYAADADFSDYDLMLTSFPHYVEFFNSQGLDTRYLQLAFDHRLLDEVTAAEPQYEVAFVGGLSSVHNERVEWLEELAKIRPFEYWGYGFERTHEATRRVCQYHGEAWGLDMYRALASAHICLNQHPASVANRYANNMRLYEATGMGRLLLTDWRENLHSIFALDEEVVSWNTPAECAEKIEWLLGHPKQMAEISAAGQKRTLQEHTYVHRSQELAALAEERLHV